MNRKEFTVVLIFTFIVIVIWIIADIIYTEPSVTADPKIQPLLEEVDPNFDTAILEQ